MSEIVEQIRRIREQRKQLESQETELMKSFKPINCSIRQLHSEFFKTKNIDHFANLDQKKTFVFVCLSIVCPSFIVGDRIKTGIRIELSKATGLAESRISHIIDEVRFLYSHYKCFKTEADYLYKTICRSLI